MQLYSSAIDFRIFDTESIFEICIKVSQRNITTSLFTKSYLCICYTNYKDLINPRLLNSKQLIKIYLA